MDGLAKEDNEFRAYGYDTSQMGVRSEATTVVDDVGSEERESAHDFYSFPFHSLHMWDPAHGYIPSQFFTLS